ncbi:hypothetical protein PR003_g35080 [Phytophthora rubi]|uniref:Uncharacterized protein n=1 Tax=Phytophthora rubi TaxID=129364 RepID=A0A6A4AM19_9STRA|nr:hypothetical protein PR003_g35080 [Phytophthora rubi]
MIVVVAALGWASPMFLIVCAQNHRIACCRYRNFDITSADFSTNCTITTHLLIFAAIITISKQSLSD